MPELTAADLSDYTGGRLPNDDVSQRLVDAALAAARRYCGWEVTPVQYAVEVVVDGPGGRVLSLPTLNLISVSAVTECGVALDVTQLDVSRRKGTVQKYPHGLWTSRDGGITVTMTHGFTEDEAADWRDAVLSSADRADRVASGSAFTAIGPFQYGSALSFGDRSQFGDAERATFDLYRVLPSP